MRKIPIYIYFFVIGGIIASICWYFIRDTFFFQKNAIQVLGIIKDLQYSNKGGCSPTISYYVNEKEYIHQSSSSTSPCPYNEWEKVNILYTPWYPEDSMIDSFVEKWLFVIIFWVISMIILYIWFFFFKKEQIKQWLIWNGLSIEVLVKEVILNRQLIVNGRHPWIIIWQYDDGNGGIYSYQSESIWFDPSEYVTKTVSVLVNPTNYKEYYMDISFLPKLK